MATFDPMQDAKQARQYAFGLDGATPERIAASAAVLISYFDADLDRIKAARAAATDRGRAEPDMLWPETIRLLDCAFDKICAAGSDQNSRAELLNELWPEAEPYQWPTRRWRSIRWQLRRIWLRPRLRQTTRSLEWIAHGYETEMRVGRTLIGVMKYQLCLECRVGYVLKIAVDSRYKGFGLGTRTVMRLHRAYPGFAWYTTAQYDTSGTFWPALAKRTGSAFTANQAACKHLLQTNKTRPGEPHQ